MPRIAAVVTVLLLACPLAGPAQGDSGLATCVEEARNQKPADAGAFVRDCMLKRQGAAFGAPKDAAASAPAPPACSDKNTLGTIRGQYQMAEQAAGEKLVDIGDIRETLLGPPPRSANQYATATTFIAISRYCQGNARLASGLSEPVYWRIDTVKDGADTSIRLDHCSKRHDAFENGCAHVIAGKER